MELKWNCQRVTRLLLQHRRRQFRVRLLIQKLGGLFLLEIFTRVTAKIGSMNKWTNLSMKRIWGQTMHRIQNVRSQSPSAIKDQLHKLRWSLMIYNKTTVCLRDLFKNGWKLRLHWRNKLLRTIRTGSHTFLDDLKPLRNHLSLDTTQTT
jgi:hypothetical protein